MDTFSSASPSFCSCVVFIAGKVQNGRMSSLFRVFRSQTFPDQTRLVYNSVTRTDIHVPGMRQVMKVVLH